MKIRMDVDWSTYKRGTEYEVPGELGCQIVGMGAGVIVEYDAPGKDTGGKMVAADKSEPKEPKKK